MRQLLPVFCFLIVQTAYAQPANDDCSGIVTFGDAPYCDGTVYTNVDATTSTVFSDPDFELPECFQGAAPLRDVWFQFEVPTDGSLVDFRITIEGVGDTPIFQPQVAVYRGECALDELQELACASAEVGDGLITLDVIGLTPGLSYFLRVNDFSASATPASGDFTVCVDEIPAIFNLGAEDFSNQCAGTLYDSGGPDGDYGNGENFSFTICPDQFYECINLDFVSYATEVNFDQIVIYAGDDTSAPVYFTLDGIGQGQTIPVPSTCVTVQLTSDGSVVQAGFEMNWQCTAAACDIPPVSSCDAPTVIDALPYSNDDLGTCFVGNTIPTPGDCGDNFITGDEHVLTYTSPGDECVRVELSNTVSGMGVSVYTDCPTSGTAECVFSSTSGTINALELEAAGTYYLVVGAGQNCGDFDILVEVVDCPNIFPPAGFCEDALSINGCEDAADQTAILSIELGPVDGDFINDVNETCWLGPGAENFTFFYFQAQEDGNFGFTIQSLVPEEASDVDFLVWGPIPSFDEMCTYAQTNVADRCSYAAGADPTGLADTHPILNIPVTDTSEGAGGDDFVSTLPTEEGQFYLILINDFGGNITSGAAVIDFGVTTPGVLDAVASSVFVQGDTAVCQNQPAQLLAGGGELYEWFPSAGLSCDDCPNPIATVDQPTTYQVEIRSVCTVDTLSVAVDIFQIDAGPDQLVCLNETVQVVAGSDDPNATYQWTGTGGTLSCDDCADPFITATTAGTFTFTVNFSAPGCDDQSDSFILTVLPVEAATYSVANDTSICLGGSAQIGGPAQPNTDYVWTSIPPGFTSTDANPTVAPTETTTYYLTATNLVSGCPVPSVDSTTVVVSTLPVLLAGADVTLCEGESFSFPEIDVENDVDYQITPAFGVDDPTDPNATITPSGSQNYTLVATRGACVRMESILATVIPASVVLNVPDSTGICVGETVVLEATVAPAGADLVWTDNFGQTLATDVTTLTVDPDDLTTYFVTLTNGNCTASDSARIRVDSLPFDLSILPQDTTVCQGEPVLLTSPIYEPSDFSDIVHQWLPNTDLLTPDSLYNAVVTPGETVTLTRTSTNGFCSEEATVTINVTPVDVLSIDPVDPLCPGESVELVLNFPDGTEDFEWTGEGLSCTDCPDPTATPNGTTTYSVTADFNGCPQAASITVEVLNSPSVSFPTVPFVCPGDVVTLNTDPNMDWDYSWTSTDPDFNPTNSPAPTVSPTTSASYTVTVQNGDCEPITATFDLIVVSEVQVSVPPTAVICSDEILSIVAEGTVNGQPATEEYTWTLDGEVVSESAALNLELEPGVYNLVVFFTDGTCLTDEATVAVTVGATFEVDLTSDDEDGEVYQGATLTLDATTQPPLAGATVVWTQNGVVIDGENGLMLVTQPNETGEVTYTVEITSAEGCVRTASITFNVLPPEYYIPNVITLNNDGLNDTFAPVILGGIELREMRIYSRWGQLIYTGPEWDGTRDGTLAPQDVYVYLIELVQLDGTVVQEEGDLTVLR